VSPADIVASQERPAYLAFALRDIEGDSLRLAGDADIGRKAGVAYPGLHGGQDDVTVFQVDHPAKLCGQVKAVAALCHLKLGRIGFAGYINGRKIS